MPQLSLTRSDLKLIYGSIIVLFLVLAYSTGSLSLIHDENSGEFDTTPDGDYSNRSSTTVSYEVKDGVLWKIINGNGYPAEVDIIADQSPLHLSGLPVDTISVINAPASVLQGEVISTPNLVIQDSPDSIIQANIFENITIDLSKGDNVIKVINSSNTLIADNIFSASRFVNGQGVSSIISVKDSNQVSIITNTFTELSTDQLTFAQLHFISIDGGEDHYIEGNVFEIMSFSAESELSVQAIRLYNVLNADILSNELYSMEFSAFDHVAFTAIYMENNTTFESTTSSRQTVIETNVVADMSLHAYYEVDFTGINVSLAREAYSLHIQDNVIADILTENGIIIDNMFLIHITGVFVHHVFYKTLTVIRANDIGTAGGLFSNNTKTTHLVAYRFLEAPNSNLDLHATISKYEGYLVADVVVDKSDGISVIFPEQLNPLIYWWHSQLPDFETYSQTMNGEFLVTDAAFKTEIPYLIDLLDFGPGVYQSGFIVNSELLSQTFTYYLDIEILDISPPEINGMGDLIFALGDPNAEYHWEISDFDLSSYELYINGVLNKSVTTITVQTLIIAIDYSIVDVGIYVMEIFVTDAAGNQGSAVATVEIVGDDNIAPVIHGDDNFVVALGVDTPLSWIIEDMNISSYEVYVNSEIIESVTAVYQSMVEIVYNTQNLALGTQNLTIVAIDWLDQHSSLEVEIVVRQPWLNIEGSDNIIVEVGSQANISWTILADIPDQLRLLVNGTEYDNGTYENGIPVIYTVYSSISNIILNYTLIVNTTSGMINSSTIFVEFVDSYAPLIKGSNDVSFLVGETGNFIRWFIIDENFEVNYTILVNGEAIYNNSRLDHNELIIGLDHLAEGKYNYTIYATDNGGNVANDTVIVVVFPVYNYERDTGQTSDPQEPAFPIDFSSPVVIGAAATMIFVGGAWVTVSRRR